MAKTSNRPNFIVLALLVIVAFVVGYLWLHGRREPAATATPSQKAAVDTSQAIAVPADNA